MKKILALCLALTMCISMIGCGCNHQWQEATCTTPKTCTKCAQTEGEAAGHNAQTWVVTSVNTAGLTMTRELPCATCGEVMDTATESTGCAPVNSALVLSAEEWYNCLLTNIHANGMGQSIYSYPTEPTDDTLLYGLVSMSQMMVVFSFLDAEGNTITTDQASQRGIVHNIRMDAQFTNDNAKEFYVLLMILAINNNSGMAPEDANTLAGHVMAGNGVNDNGYAYAMEIVSKEDHRVCVSITAV